MVRQGPRAIGPRPGALHDGRQGKALIDRGVDDGVVRYLAAAYSLEVVYPSDADGSLPMVRYTEHRRMARRDINTGAALTRRRWRIVLTVP